MRRTNSFTIEQEDGGKLEVKVFELRPYDLLNLHHEIQDQKLPIGEYERLLPFCVNLTKKELLALYPNEMALIIEKFKDVNRDFFAPWPSIKKVVEKLGLVEWGTDLFNKSGMLEMMKTAISTDLQKLFVSLPKGGITDQSATDGGISESPLSLEEKSVSSKLKPSRQRH
jgi:hypothetical protein